MLTLQGCDSLAVVVDPLLRTGEASYTLESDDHGTGTVIDYTFMNRTGHPVFIPNCGGAFDVVLERAEEDDWVRSWSPAILSCLSPPIVIEDGEDFDGSLHVWGSQPGSNSAPRFDREDVEGTYRMVWPHVLSSYQDHLPFGEPIPLEQRTSNSFALVSP